MLNSGEEKEQLLKNYKYDNSFSLELENFESNGL